MELFGYNSPQPNQKAAATKNYDSEFVVATISRFCNFYSDNAHTSHSCTIIQLNIAASFSNFTANNSIQLDSANIVHSHNHFNL